MMGSYNPSSGLSGQQNTAGMLNTMANLVKQKALASQGIGQAVDEFGQGRARGKIADLMGSGQLDGKTPEQAQALIQGVTGGRDVGDAGRKTIAELMTSTRGTQKNEWSEEAAKLANTRAIGLEGVKQGNRIALGKEKGEITDTPTLTGDQYAQAKVDISGFMDIANDKTKTKEERSAARKSASALRFKTNQSLGRTGMDSKSRYKMGLFSENNGGGVNELMGFGKNNDDLSAAAHFKYANKAGWAEKIPYEKGKPTMYMVKNEAGVSVPVNESTMMKMAQFRRSQGN